MKVREGRSEVGKGGKQIYNDSHIVHQLGVDSQAPRHKAGYSTGTCAESSKTASDICTTPQNLSEREERIYLLGLPCSFFCHLSIPGGESN